MGGRLASTVCPSVIMKDMLHRGVVKIKKGDMPALYNDIRKAQVATYLFGRDKHPEGV